MDTHTHTHTPYTYIYTYTCMHTMEYFSAIKKNGVIPIEPRWMDLKFIIWKMIAYTIWTFVIKVMSLLSNTWSRLVITCLPRSKHILISWLQSPSPVILEPKKIKSLTVSIVSPYICHEVIERDAVILIFWMLSFKPAFSLSSSTFIKGLLVPLHFYSQ